MFFFKDRSDFPRQGRAFASSGDGDGQVLTPEKGRDDKIRRILEEKYGEEYASLLFLIGAVRSDLKRQGIVVSSEVWHRALDLDLLSGFLRSGELEKAKTVLLSKLKVAKGEKYHKKRC